MFFCGVLFLAAGSVAAQPLVSLDPPASAGKAAEAAVSAATIKNFNRQYQNVYDVSWELLKDGGSRCCFTDKKGSVWAIFSSKDKWLYSVADYDPAQLPKQLLSQLAESYAAYSLVHVKEVRTCMYAHPYYLVEIRTDKVTKIIRFNDEGMEEVKDFRRNQ